MRGRCVLLSLLLLAPAAPTLAADVTGSWQVTISTKDGTITGVASLKQAGDVVTGWVGHSKDDPIPIAGTLKKSKLTLKTSPQTGRTVAFDKCNLTVDGDKMSGTFEQSGSTDTGTIKFIRSK
jgi:hypothetical protein